MRKMTPSAYINIAFTFLFGLPLLSIFPTKKKGRINAPRTHICHCATKRGKGIVFPGHYPKVMGMNVKTRVIHLAENTRPVSEPVLLLISVSSYHWDSCRFKTRLLSTRSVCTKPANLWIQQTALLCLFIALRWGFLGQIGILTVGFCFG